MNGVNGTQPAALQWQLGLMNHHGRYLTAETFGFKLNASGATLKKKQLWTLEQDPSDERTVYLRSHLGRYLSGSKKGDVSCESEEKSADEKFTIEYSTDGSGRWAIRSLTFSYYLGGTEENIRCYEKQAGVSEWWTAHLAIHPQVNIRSVARKAYARMQDDEIRFNELIPWGADAILNLEFTEGRYAVRSFDGRYVQRDGELVDQPGPDSLYNLEIWSGQNAGFALKDSAGKYLTTTGKDGMLQARKSAHKVSKDDIFTLEDSQLQGFITSLHNGKKVSIKQGLDITANQDEATDTEIFQVELDKKAGEQCRIRTCQNTLWVLDSSSSGIQTGSPSRSKESVFRIEWLDDGALALRASNNRYVTARPNGSLYAVSTDITTKEKFFFSVVNRPRLVLRCEHGFIGTKKGLDKIECNKISCESISLEHTDGQSGVHYFKGANGKYWGVGSDGSITCNSSSPQPLVLELKRQGHFCIKAPNGNYISGEQNGIVSAKSSELGKHAYWEF